MKIVHFQRLANSSNHSIERVFASVRSALPGVDVDVNVCRFASQGVFKRLYNIVDAARRQGDVNHITGDVHYLALSLSKRKTILTIHDCVSLRSSKGLNHARILWFWYRLPIRRVAAVTVISAFTRDEILRYTACDPNILQVVPDPVPIEFVPSPKMFPVEQPVVLQVGTGEHNKNVCRVAEALRGIPCQLDVIGRLTERQRQALEVNSISHTEQWGLSDQEVVERYRKCDLVVFASTYEGFGMPIIESNAVGRPVVTSSLEPMISVAGGAACLVDPYDPLSIRAGILRIIEDRGYREELVRLGFENAKRFSAEVVAQQYVAVYRELASANIARK